MRAGDIYIINHFGTIIKAEIVEITQSSICYANIDDNNKQQRVSKAKFENEYSIIEIIHGAQEAPKQTQ